MQHEDEDHSILEDDSQDEEGDDQDEFMDEDDSSSLSVPNESIDFDLVYSLHTFVATVDGQANVVKGDSLFLMDDSNSYWWLVRVLKTQEVGYIPAENIETPYERLARLNKHRNVDVRFTPFHNPLPPLLPYVDFESVSLQLHHRKNALSTESPTVRTRRSLRLNNTILPTRYTRPMCASETSHSVEHPCTTTRLPSGTRRSSWDGRKKTMTDIIRESTTR